MAAVESGSHKFERLDVALVSRGIVASRTRARAAVDAGLVTVNGSACSKASAKVGPLDEIASAEASAYVSRGGLKLEAALDAFGVDPRGRRCLDVGASTGGFTDCLLQRGASHVTAIDVGSGQLAARIANDPRVTAFEGINARSLDIPAIGGPFEIIVVDISFISLRLVLRSLHDALKPDGALIALIKPQFEVGRAGIGAGGIVRNDVLRRSAVDGVLQAAGEMGLVLLGKIESPIRGGDGNTEFLAYFVKDSARICP